MEGLDGAAEEAKEVEVVMGFVGVGGEYGVLGNKVMVYVKRCSNNFWAKEMELHLEYMVVSFFLDMFSSPGFPH